MNRFPFAALAAVICMSTPVVAQAAQINLTITGVRNSSGIVRCGLFDSAAGFREPGREMSKATGAIRGDRSSCTFKSVPDGTYAIAVFHAERGERKVDVGMFGKPKQGVGFSRNPSITFGPPSFNAASFIVRGAPVNLTIGLSY